MPSFTAGYPKRSGNTEADTRELFDWAESLVDELKYVLSNIDEYNISEAYTKYVKETNNAE